MKTRCLLIAGTIRFWLRVSLRSIIAVVCVRIDGYFWSDEQLARYQDMVALRESHVFGEDEEDPPDAILSWKASRSTAVG